MCASGRYSVVTSKLKLPTHIEALSLQSDPAYFAAAASSSFKNAGDSVPLAFATGKSVG